MASLGKVLAAESSGSSVGAGSERKNALYKYRLVKNERSIDIYEEGVSPEMKEIKVRVQKDTGGKAEKRLSRYDNRYNNGFYENDLNHLIERRNFRIILTNPSNSFAPSLKEAAIRAMVSIVITSVNSFAKNETFRASLRHNCLASLSHDLKSVSDLRKIMLSVERTVRINSDPTELKKASLKLVEMINGVDDYQLIACADLYLGIIYKLQRKERISAKHILRVFVYSPFNARIILLPDLWDRLFSPNLSHLKSWYNREVNCRERFNTEKRMKIIEKRYYELIYKGTHDLANYYLKWLEGEIDLLFPYVSAVSINSEIPSECFESIQHTKTLKSRSLCANLSKQRKMKIEPALNDDECSVSSLLYPFRPDVPQGKQNVLILRKLALETFKLNEENIKDS